MVWPVLGLLAAAFVFSAALTHVVLRISRRIGALDSPGAAGHEKELRAIPNTGGIAVFLAIALPLAIGLVVVWGFDAEALRSVLPALEGPEGDPDKWIRRAQHSARTAAAMLAGMVLLHVAGLIDDRRSLHFAAKFGLQFAVATVMVIWFDVRMLEVLPEPLTIVITILWIVAVINAMNFIDNMDGLAAGVGVIAGGLFLAACLLNAQWFIAAVLALMVGALAGFLIYNFPPAKIFMGDCGSLVIGFLFAVLTVRTTFFDEADPNYALGTGWYGVFMPLCVLAIPLYDLCSVTIIRLSQGRSPFVGDQQHFSHRLAQRGLSKRSAVLLIWLAATVTGIGGISLGRLLPWQALLVGVQTLLVLCALAVFEYSSRDRQSQAARSMA